jgi:hypothetical protein
MPVDFVKYRGPFCKTNEARPIRAIRAPDQTAGNGRRRGHVVCPELPLRIRY